MLPMMMMMCLCVLLLLLLLWWLLLCHDHQAAEGGRWGCPPASFFGPVQLSWLRRVGHVRVYMCTHLFSRAVYPHALSSDHACSGSRFILFDTLEAIRVIYTYICVRISHMSCVLSPARMHIL